MGDRKSVNLPVKTTYLVSGLNHEILLNRLKKHQIPVYHVKKRGKKQLYLTIHRAHDKKLFAITKDLCYNIRKIRDTGRFYPFLRLFKNVGVPIGVLAFIILTTLSSNRIYSFSFTGDGSVYSNEVQEILTEEGVEKFSSFSGLDLKKLANVVFQKSDKFSFVSLTKRGNTLIIDLSLIKNPPSVIDGTKDSMTATFSGKIERLKVYRGTVVKGEGDFVKVGDTIVSGYYNFNETVSKIGVIAVCSIVGEVSKTFTLDDQMEDIALILAEESIKNGEIINSSVQKEGFGGQFNYQVNLTVRYVIKSG